MPRRSGLALKSTILAAILLAPFGLVGSKAFAQTASAWVDPRKLDPVPSLSSELLDPSGTSRFHLITRAAFANQEKAFSSNQLWSFEARAHLRVIEGLALAAVLPFGFSKGPGSPNQFLIGNFTVGIAGGGKIRLKEETKDPEPVPALRLGGGLDVYAPTAKKPDTTDTFLSSAQLSIARMRSYEPYLYVSNVMSFRARGHAGVEFGIFSAALELGIVPAFTLSSSSDFLLWFSVGGRASVRPVEWVEPYLEMGSAILISGPQNLVVMPGVASTRDLLSPPFLITPGARFHFLGVDPAAFVSFNFKDTKAIIFGIDLAGAVRKSRNDLSDDIFRGFGNQ